MICTHCEKSTRVLHTKSSTGEVCRRRECPHCGQRFNTVERTADAQLGVDARVRKVMAGVQEVIEDAAKRYG